MVGNSQVARALIATPSENQFDLRPLLGDAYLVLGKSCQT